MPIRARGFTLIEVLVVVLLLVIVVAMAGIRVGVDEGHQVRQESERLATLLQVAQQEAILEGRVLALSTHESGYEFQGLNDKNKFTRLASDEVLRGRELPPAMRIQSVTLDGAPTESKTRILLYPTGELSQAFEITLGQGEARGRVEGKLDGAIVSTQPET